MIKINIEMKLDDKLQETNKAIYHTHKVSVVNNALT